MQLKIKPNKNVKRLQLWGLPYPLHKETFDVKLFFYMPYIILPNLWAPSLPQLNFIPFWPTGFTKPPCRATKPNNFNASMRDVVDKVILPSSCELTSNLLKSFSCCLSFIKSVMILAVSFPWPWFSLETATDFFSSNKCFSVIQSVIVFDTTFFKELAFSMWKTYSVEQQITLFCFLERPFIHLNIQKLFQILDETCGLTFFTAILCHVCDRKDNLQFKYFMQATPTAPFWKCYVAGAPLPRSLRSLGPAGQAWPLAIRPDVLSIEAPAEEADKSWPKKGS